MKRVLHHIRTILSYTAMAVLLVISAALLVTRIPAFGLQAYSVLTGSMEPTIPTGSLIVTKKPTNESAISTGTIITFEEPGYQNKLITHRVIGQQQGQFLTQGDANTAPDPWKVPYSRIHGVYATHLPIAGKALESMKSPLGLLLFVALPVVIIGITECKNIINILVDKKVQHILRTIRSTPLQPKILPPSPNTINSNRLDSIQQPPIITTPPMKLPPQTPRYKKILGTLAISCLVLAAAAYLIHPAFAQFISASIKISDNSVSTAVDFSTPTPTPTPTDTPTITPTPTPTPTPTIQPTSTPSTTPTPTPDVEGDCDNIHIEKHLSNTDTAPGSTNENSVSIHTKCKTEQSDNNTSTNVSNEINIEANTGDNHTDADTVDKNITSGNITVDVNTSTNKGQ